MKIAIGSDHRGIKLKKVLMEYLAVKGHTFKDFGAYSQESCDYPEFALKVANAVANKEYERGILICNSGIGMDMAANKIKKIRAANCFTVAMAKFSRLHNDANILVLGAAMIKKPLAKRITAAWLGTPFEGGRHLRRIKIFSETN